LSLRRELEAEGKEGEDDWVDFRSDVDEKLDALDLRW
jgi:hypothetical protein